MGRYGGFIVGGGGVRAQRQRHGFGVATACLALDRVVTRAYRKVARSFTLSGSYTLVRTSADEHGNTYSVRSKAETKTYSKIIVELFDTLTLHCFYSITAMLPSSIIYAC